MPASVRPFSKALPGAEVASAVACPVLLVHGLADDTVPADEAREIHAARASDAVELLLIPGSHDDYGDIDLHIDGLRHFLQRAFTAN